jgi:hypothetical protein
MTADRPATGRRELEDVARSMRGALGSLRAATETLGAYPDLDPERRSRLLAVVAEEAARIDHQVRRMESLAAGTREPAERRRTAVATLLDGLLREATGAGLDCDVETAAGAPPDDARLEADLEALLRAARGFFADLRRAMAVTRCTVRARVVDRHLLVDLGWSPDPGDLPRVFEWQGGALGAGPGADGGLREVAREHDGEAWFNLDRDGSAAHVRILLPLAVAAAVPV